jgi:hypothetical protein
MEHLADGIYSAAAVVWCHELDPEECDPDEWEAELEPNPPRLVLLERETPEEPEEEEREEKEEPEERGVEV